MVLTVNGVIIGEEQIVGEMDRIREEYTSYVRDHGGEASEEQLREWAEENLIEIELLRQQAVATQPEPSAERVEQWIKDHAEYYGSIPEGERLARAKDDMRVRRLEKEIRKTVPKAGEEEVRRDYERNQELYITPETLRVSHICRLIGPGIGSKASGYLELLRLKTDLANGVLGWFEAVEASDTYEEDRGFFQFVTRGDLPAAVEERLFALKPGEVSDVIELDEYSLHLFRVLAIDPPASIPFESIRERLKVILFERAYREALEQFIDNLKEKASIERRA